MLTKFIVENYKNFCDPLTMDFIDTHDYMFNNHCVKNGLLNKVIIYGANSSGKSNLGFALFDIVSMLTDKNVNFLMQKNKESFINADSDKIDASFTYYFKKDNDIIKYAYRKSSPSTIIYEELSINDEIVYTYDFVLGKHNFANLELIGAQNLNFEYFDKNIAILRYIANNTIQKEDSYVKYIMNFVSNMLWFRCSKANE